MMSYGAPPPPPVSSSESLDLFSIPPPPRTPPPIPCPPQTQDKARKRVEDLPAALRIQDKGNREAVPVMPSQPVRNPSRITPELKTIAQLKAEMRCSKVPIKMSRDMDENLDDVELTDQDLIDIRLLTPSTWPNSIFEETKLTTPDSEDHKLSPIYSSSNYSEYMDLPYSQDKESSEPEDEEMPDEELRDEDESFLDMIPVDELERSQCEKQCHYQELRVLAAGGNGKCYLLRRPDDGALHVCKVIQSRPEYINIIPREVEILQNIFPENDRIMRIHSHVNLEWQSQIYSEYYAGGDLLDFARQWEVGSIFVPEIFLWHCLKQLCEAVVFLQYGYDAEQGRSVPSKKGGPWKSIIHGDIKLENIFIRHWKDDVVKLPDLVLGDFGNSIGQHGSPLMGTAPWMPPEDEATYKADVWGIGAVIYALACDGTPPRRMPPAESFGERHLPPQKILGQYSWALNRLVSSALEFHVDDRISAFELLRHAYAGFAACKKDLVDRLSVAQVAQPSICGCGIPTCNQMHGSGHASPAAYNFPVARRPQGPPRAFSRFHLTPGHGVIAPKHEALVPQQPVW